MTSKSTCTSVREMRGLFVCLSRPTPFWQIPDILRKFGYQMKISVGFCNQNQTVAEERWMFQVQRIKVGLRAIAIGPSRPVGALHELAVQSRGRGA